MTTPGMIDCQRHGPSPVAQDPAMPWPRCSTCPPGTPSALAHFCAVHGLCTSVVHTSAMQPTSCWRCSTGDDTYVLSTQQASTAAGGWRLRARRTYRAAALLGFLALCGVLAWLSWLTLAWDGSPVQPGTLQAAWLLGIADVICLRKLARIISIFKNA